MMQDPNKDIQKPSVKEKLARYSAKKKVGVGEMGKPDLKAGFEAAMQKERDFVLNRAKKREEGKERLTRMVKDVKGEDYPASDSKKFDEWVKKNNIISASEQKRRSEIINAMKPLKSMSKPKGKY